VDYKPLKIPQKFWAKTATIKSIPVAVALFLLNQGMFTWTRAASDDLMEYKKIKEEKSKKREAAKRKTVESTGEQNLAEAVSVSPEKESLYSEEAFKEQKRVPHVFPGFLLRKVAKKYGWHKEDSRALPFLTFLQLSRIPLYFFALQVAPFALLPSLIPWKYVLREQREGEK
jgi:hypothetical protein